MVPGVRLTGLHAGIKKRKSDLALIVFDEPQVAASCITTNEIKAAPVVLSEEHLRKHGDSMRVVVCNAGCANACTGERGMRDAKATARQAAALLHVESGQVIVASTGVIGVHLPMDRMHKALDRAVKDLETGSEAAYDAAEAIMTTDKVPKLASFAFYDGKERYTVGGIAKGSGMIAPNMATMLAFVATNAPVPRAELQTALRDAVEDTFNMISVDGDMSTNDAIYAFAPKPAGENAKAARRFCRGAARRVQRSGAADGQRRRRRDEDDDGQRDRRARRGTSARGGPRGGEQQSRPHGAPRRRPELGPHHRRRRRRERGR